MFIYKGDLNRTIYIGEVENELDSLMVMARLMGLEVNVGKNDGVSKDYDFMVIEKNGYFDIRFYIRLHLENSVIVKGAELHNKVDGFFRITMIDEDYRKVIREACKYI